MKNLVLRGYAGNVGDGPATVMVARGYMRKDSKSSRPEGASANGFANQRKRKFVKRCGRLVR
jgi:hypothetical protein